MAARLGNALFVLGALVAALCAVAVVYLVGWGEGPGAEFGKWMFGIIGMAALLIGYGVSYVIGD